MELLAAAFSFFLLIVILCLQETVGVKWESAFLHFTDEEIDGNIMTKR